MKITNAAGTAKTVPEAQAVLDTASPDVVLGSFTMAERTGNPGTVDYFGPAYSLNVRGIPSPGFADWCGTVMETARRAHAIDKRVVVSVAAFDLDEYRVLADLAFSAGADVVELNFGCPNMQEGGAFAPVFSYRPEVVADALDGMPDREIWAKVSPIFDDALFDALLAALRGRVAGVVATNTLPQCLALGSTGAPALSFGTGVGGMAGPALKPIALAQAARYVRAGMRVIGVGGITTGADLRDYLAVGAESAQVNTIIQTEGPSAITRILKEASL